jgi:hypothetical protein
MAELNKILIEKKKGEFVRCLVEKLMIYALGRGLEYYDDCSVETICKTTAAHGYRFSQMVQAIAESAPFQMRRGEKK